MIHIETLSGKIRACFLPAAALLLLAAACGHNRPAVSALDYTDTRLWYCEGGANPDNADIFYVMPTCIWDWTDSAGQPQHHMDPYDPQQRGTWAQPMKLARDVFGNGQRFFSPYYRQISMDSWLAGEEVIRERLPLAMEDVRNAFRHYLRNWNDGRPFILAGHSQGAAAVLELLAELDEKSAARLVAAYAVGYEITEDDLQRIPALRPARDSVDLGVTVCFNSAAFPEAASPLFSDNCVSINPMNWRTDSRSSTAGENRGSVFFAADGSILEETREITARLEHPGGLVLVDGLNPEDWYIPQIGSLFPCGNYHVQELNIYFRNLQHNVSRRILHYRLQNETI